MCRTPSNKEKVGKAFVPLTGPLCFLLYTVLDVNCDFILPGGVYVCVVGRWRGGVDMTLQRVVTLHPHIPVSSTLGLTSGRLSGCSLN